MKIGIIGLGYVGLPLARLFATRYDVVGFDINKERIAALKLNYDHTGELEESTLKAVQKELNTVTEGLYYTHSAKELADVSVYIITVPTPIDKNNNPDLAPLLKASELVGSFLKKD